MPHSQANPADYTFDALLTRNRDLAMSHEYLADAIVAMRAGWADTARSLLNDSNQALRAGGYTLLTTEPYYE